MDKKFDLVTIGDSTIDTFIKINDASVECDLNHKDCKICLRYGEKIPVELMGHGVAGNAANVAVAASKLGLKVAICTNLGDDEHGDQIKASFEKNGVANDYVVVNGGKTSNLSLVLTFKGERTILVYHQNWYYSLPKLADSSWVYLTSTAESFVRSNLMGEVTSYAEKSKAKLIFAPGTHQLNADIKRFPRLLERCDFLIVNVFEAKKVLEKKPSETADVKDLLSKLLLLGPKVVVITDGEEGSYASDGKKNLKAGIFPTQIVEKTGAGDAYSAGFLAALFYNQPLEEALIWGTINASHVICELGPQNGLLTREELDRHRKAVPELVAAAF